MRAVLAQRLDFARAAEDRAAAELLIVPPMTHIDLLDWTSFDAAIEAGTVAPAEAKALVLALAVKRLGSKETAEKWYRSQHLEAFGGRTPAQMVRGGELKALVALMRAEAAQKKG